MCRWIIILLVTFCGITGCEMTMEDNNEQDSLSVTLPTDTLTKADSFVAAKDSNELVVNKVVTSTGKVHPADVVEYAKTLIGVKYKYGSIDPNQGFDCSGFITYVFNHFNIQVPRSSIDFTQVGRTIPKDSAKPGDIVLFTGTDSTEKFVGHMGIIVSNKDGVVEFIHSTSGKAFGVTITPLSNYYLSRYVRTARVFPQNESNY
jgi:cell wall-associated NlpC family hydrolase